MRTEGLIYSFHQDGSNTIFQIDRHIPSLQEWSLEEDFVIWPASKYPLNWQESKLQIMIHFYPRNVITMMKMATIIHFINSSAKSNFLLLTKEKNKKNKDSRKNSSRLVIDCHNCRAYSHLLHLLCCHQNCICWRNC